MSGRHSFGSVLLVMVLLMGALCFCLPAAEAEQAGDFTYSVGGSPAGATVTGYTGSGGSVTIPATLGGYPVVAIGANAFHTVTSITSISMPDSVLVIEQQAFYGCGYMTSITLSKNLTTIGGWAFDLCSNLPILTIPASVMNLGDYVIQNNAALTTINFAGLVAPTNVSATWYNGPTMTRGHAYAASNFPSPGSSFHGLTMGAALTTLPNAPSGMTIMAGNGQAALNWNAPSDGGSPITTYKLYRSASQSGAYSILASPTGTSYTDGGLTSGQTYWYKVSAVNANGEGQASNPISTTIPGSDNTMIYVVLIVIIIAIAAVAIVYYMRHKDG